MKILIQLLTSYAPQLTKIPNGPIPSGSETYLSAVYRIVHNRHPAFEDSHLKQAKVSLSYLVEVHVRVDPGEVSLKTNLDGRNYYRIHQLSIVIYALHTPTG